MITLAKTSENGWQLFSCVNWWWFKCDNFNGHSCFEKENNALDGGTANLLPIVLFFALHPSKP